EGFMLDTYPGNSLRFLNRNGTVRYDAKLPADRWTHVAGVYSASKKIMKLYLNGQEVASAGGAFPPLSVTPPPLRIGSDSEGDNRFVGRIRRAAVYRRALAATEIAARAANPEAPAPAGVIGDWKLDATAPGKIAPLAGTLPLK